MKLALVYDRLNKIGGAEEVLKSLHAIWPQAPWYTALHDPVAAPFTREWTVHASSLNKVPFLVNRHEAVPYLMPFVFENLDFGDCNVVVSVSSAEAKGIVTKPETLHINYCLTPTRYLWSHQEEYMKSNQFKWVKSAARPLVRSIVRAMQTWDQVAAQRPDIMISISEHVKKRVKKYYNRDTDVIYPPVDTKKYAMQSKQTPDEKNYLLTVGRLVPYKKLDILVDVAKRADKTLVMVGEGVEKRRLKKRAGKHLVMKGLLDEEALIAYYQNCDAFLAANEEDFGLAMVEAQAAGKPVIAYRKGGASEIVTQETGLLIQDQKAASFLQALDKLETMNIASATCQRNAERFDKKVFEKKFKSRIEEAWQKHRTKT